DIEKLNAMINVHTRAIAGKDADGLRFRSAMPFALMRVASILAKDFGILPAGLEVCAAIDWAWLRFTAASGAEVMKPDELAIRMLGEYIARNWNQTIIPCANANHIKGTRPVVAWYDADAVYLLESHLVEAAGGKL